MTPKHQAQGFRIPFDIWNGYCGFLVLATFLLLLIHTLPLSPEGPLQVSTPSQSIVHMDDLCHCDSILNDDVVTPIIEGADDIQLVVEWVVGANNCTMYRNWGGGGVPTSNVLNQAAGK